MPGPTGPHANGYAEGLEQPGSVEAAEAQGRKRLQEMYERLDRESYGPMDFGYEAAEGLLAKGKVYAIALPGIAKKFPKWQFPGGSLRPRPEIPELVEAAKEAGLDAIGFTNVMINPDAGNGQAPVELLDEGAKDLVLGIIRAQGVNTSDV